MENLLDSAQRFARALDREEYDTARACLSPECVYTIAGREHRGPAAIIASYRDAGEWASTHLDAVRYESTVRLEQPDRAVITFVDHLRRGEAEITHRCEQHLEFDDAGRIRRIEHVDLPGEPEAVRKFLDRTGPELG